MTGRARVIVITEELECWKSSLVEVWLCKAEVASVPNLETMCFLLDKGSWGNWEPMQNSSDFVPYECRQQQDTGRACGAKFGSAFLGDFLGGLSNL